MDTTTTPAPSGEATAEAQAQSARSAPVPGSGDYYASVYMVGSYGTVYYQIFRRRRWFFDESVSRSPLELDQARAALAQLSADSTPEVAAPVGSLAAAHGSALKITEMKQLLSMLVGINLLFISGYLMGRSGEMISSYRHIGLILVACVAVVAIAWAVASGRDKLND